VSAVLSSEQRRAQRDRRFHGHDTPDAVEAAQARVAQREADEKLLAAQEEADARYAERMAAEKEAAGPALAKAKEDYLAIREDRGEDRGTGQREAAGAHEGRLEGVQRARLARTAPRRNRGTAPLRSGVGARRQAWRRRPAHPADAAWRNVPVLALLLRFGLGRRRTGADWNRRP